MSRRVDIAIVGAGAAGCVLAYRLAAAGLSVHVVERGHRLAPSTVRHNEFDMLPRVYKNGGPQATDDRAISILQGAGVSGSTVINNAIWLRAELDRLLPEWAALGAHLERAALDSAYTQLEELLHVSPVPRGLMTKGTNLFTAGCDKLELPYTYLKNNRAECTGCGWCNYACRYDRKTSALVTFAPWAEHYGAVIEDQCADVRLTRRGNRITGLSYTRARRRYQLDADHVIVSCGAISSSAFLLQNGVTCRGQVGRRFHVLGGVLVTAFVHDGLESYDGIGLTCMTRPDTRYLLESFYATPGACAVTMPGWGRTYGERMSHYASGAQASAMVATGPHGRIRLRRDGSTRITLSLTAAEVEATALGQEQLARIYLAGGAETVAFGLLCETTVCSENDIVSQRRALRDRSNLIFGSAHPQGGNTMSDDPGRGVVDSRFRAHGLIGLSVIDASILPTNLFANCQATVMALGWVAADEIMAGHQ